MVRRHASKANRLLLRMELIGQKPLLHTTLLLRQLLTGAAGSEKPICSSRQRVPVRTGPHTVSWARAIDVWSFADVCCQLVMLAALGYSKSSPHRHDIIYYSAAIHCS